MNTYDTAHPVRRPRPARACGRCFRRDGRVSADQPGATCRSRSCPNESSHPVEGGSANDYDYCSGDPINCNDLAGTKQRPLTLREAQEVAKIAGECTPGSGAYLVGSSFCKRFLGDLRKGNLTAFGFGFIGDNRRIPGQQYFQACATGAATSAPFGAIGGPVGAGKAAALGCGAAVLGQIGKEQTPIPDEVIDAALVAFDVYGAGNELRRGFIRVVRGGRFLGG